jgi:multidrug efflux pump subunit AcrA (membrane-fusion protein)
MTFLGVLTACERSIDASEKSASRAVVQAPVAIVEKHPVQARYEAVGTVCAKVSSTIQSKMMGHVLTVNVREGDRVDAGQVLVEIDSREAESRAKSTEGAVREAEEAQKETESAIQAAMRSKDAADAGNTLASSTFKRYQGLLASKAVSPQVFDEVEAKQKEAMANAARAADMVLSAQAKLGEVNARIEQAKAEFENARTLLSFAKVTAPFAGIITGKSVDVGDLAAPGIPLLTVEDPQQYRLETQVNEEQVHGMVEGAKASVVLDALGKGENGEPPPLDGTIAEIVPSADPVSRTFVVKIDLPRDPAIKSGMFGRALFDTGQKHTVTIPETALFHRGQLDGVYVVDEGNVARLRLVTVGKRYASDIEVLSGLELGERIVEDKTDQVADGAVVQ